jgi:hypothetical protein
MRRADLLACVQMKCVAGNVAIDVTQQIFVRRDTEAGRSALPFDYESAPPIDIRERADWAFIRLNMAVASNSYPSAASHQNDTRREKNNRNLLHANMISLITMRQRVVLDSGKIQGRASLRRALRLLESRRSLFIPQSLVLPCRLKRRRRRIPRDNCRLPNRLRVASV